MARRLPLADSELVEAIRAQQSWVTGRFPEAERERLWLLPRPTKNADGSGHISANQLSNWIRAWVDAIPAIDALPTDGRGEAVPFDRAGITPHAFRHTYAQTWPTRAWRLRCCATLWTIATWPPPSATTG